MICKILGHSYKARDVAFTVSNGATLTFQKGCEVTPTGVGGIYCQRCGDKK